MNDAYGDMSVEQQVRHDIRPRYLLLPRHRLPRHRPRVAGRYPR